MRRYRHAAARALTFIAALATLGLQGCPALIGIGGVAAFTSLEDRRTAGTQLEDSGIESRAITRINERVGERAHVNVTVYNRAVLLTGEAWDDATRTEIENIARAVPNVRAITNEIQVAGLSSATSRANDTVLTARVKGSFLNSKDFSSLHVKVVTEAAVVYLLGVVTEAEGNAAAELARTTSGVRKVVKVFDYCQPTDDLCRPAAPPKPKPAA